MVYNTEFLRALDNQKVRMIFARITSLNQKDYPLETIEGRVTGGSINIDGQSALQRSCSLSLVASDISLNEYYWGLKTKIKLEIGILNRVDSSQPDIIWFKQGVFLLTEFRVSQDVKNYTIELSGQDKMSQLNGTLGGLLPHSLRLDVLETIQGDDIITEKVLIKDMIIQLVHTFGGESMENIVINDLKDNSLELLGYSGGDSICLKYDHSKKEIIGRDDNEPITGSTVYDNLLELQNAVNIDDSKLNNELGVYVRIFAGEYIGYRQNAMVFPTELIANPGESVTSALDKIINVFTSFTYYYNLDGQFVFEEKQDYILASVDKEKLYTDGLSLSPMSKDKEVIYDFSALNLLTNIKLNPTLSNIKNDFTIQGKTKGLVDNKGQMIRMRYAIDKKPTYYKNFEGKEFSVGRLKADGEEYIAEENLDWRELIFQMALDHSKYNQEIDFYQKIYENNPDFISGITGYEDYYIDVLSFWRYLYFRDGLGGAEYAPSQALKDGKPKFDYYYTSSKSTSTGSFIPEWGWTKIPKEDYVFWFDFIEDTGPLGVNSVKNLGSKKVIINDDNIGTIFSRDIPDIVWVGIDEELTDESKNKIHFRVNDKYVAEKEFLTLKDAADYISENKDNKPKNFNINSPSNEEIFPSEKFSNDNFEWEDKGVHNEHGSYWKLIENTGEQWKYQGKPTAFFDTEFTKTYLPLSAQEKFVELLQKHSGFNNNISLTSLPIYYLQPNKKIILQDKEVGLSGQYTLSKITLPLTYNGTMSITATEVPEQLF